MLPYVCLNWGTSVKGKKVLPSAIQIQSELTLSVVAVSKPSTYNSEQCMFANTTVITVSL